MTFQSYVISKGSVTIVADFSPEFNLQFRWRSEHQTKNHRAYQSFGLFWVSKQVPKKCEVMH